MKTFTQNSDENLDYTINWTEWIGQDTIASVIWTVDSGITKTASTNTTKKTTIWLTGGTLGSNYNVKVQITTTFGRIKDAFFILYVQTPS